MGGVFILAGLISASVVGWALDKWKRYTLLFKLINWGACIFAGCMLFCIKISFPVMLINIALLGAFVIPIVPVGYALGVELTYPINPALANGFMISIGMVWAVLLTLAGGPFAE